VLVCDGEGLQFARDCCIHHPPAQLELHGVLSFHRNQDALVVLGLARHLPLEFGQLVQFGLEPVVEVVDAYVFACREVKGFVLADLGSTFVIWHLEQVGQ